jgi:D-glycero-D-manno-heptose 1,7-bisphosphate phosphatase
MLLTASRELNIDLDGSIMVGDKPSDMEAAQRAGVGMRFQVTQGSVDSDVIAVASLLEVVDCLRG